MNDGQVGNDGQGGHAGSPAQSGAGAGTATATGTGTGGAASSSTGGGTGAGGSSSTSTASGSTCHGDAAAWSAITAQPISCTKNSDCCVVVNGCLSAVQVVPATDFATAGAAWPYCEDQCNNCIAPLVEVGCVDQVCTGELKDGSGPTTDHCGVDTTPVAPPVPKQIFNCGGMQQGGTCHTDADCAADLVCTCPNDACHDCGTQTGSCVAGCFGG